jgi:hypothetical protein
VNQQTHQTQQSGHAAPAIAPLRTLAELGDGGIRRVVETDLTPRWPFAVVQARHLSTAATASRLSARRSRRNRKR